MMMLTYPMVILILTTLLVEVQSCPGDTQLVCFKPIDYNNQDPKVKNVAVQLPTLSGSCINKPQTRDKTENDNSPWRSRCCGNTEVQKLVQPPYDPDKKFTMPKKILVNGRPLDSTDTTKNAICS
ncbi:hypothetical protein PTTG_26682 [Puccinia triticina 1-1 BBBD Race 1]|uniref:Secreted protein n=2 Tax=Puccinia triticina TaxID=208348 RepID=A0A180GTF2_PUCT1|nr:uncharacterized protein PtA15_3A451 [Puccinia triticina]OAV95253.1 hypothetical protein PTTG_26682 [Puccinia triticina 1-1 BBBD Race 1]WAQ83084.1 hypothetical protein PtA15_3A451 [Puccinia triticina]